MADTLLQRARTVLPAGVELGVATIGEGIPADLIRPEDVALERMAPKRRTEFLAGRLALRRAQESLGVAGFAVPNGSDRAPQWPDGFCGSISHAGGVAMAAVGSCADGFASIGLDIEEDAPLDVALRDLVLRPAERGALGRGDDAGREARTIFCIKECTYKAQYPLSREVFGFEVVEVNMESGNGVFEARFMRDVAPFRTGERLRGRYSAGNGLIIAGMSLRRTGET